MTSRSQMSVAQSGQSDAEPSGLVERVARAICRPVYAKMMSHQPAEVIAKYVEINWPNHVDQAREALEAMREPILATVSARRAIYETKAAQAARRDEVDYTRHDLSRHAVEAMEHAESEIAGLFAALAEEAV